jgi:hypothetical protein
MSQISELVPSKLLNGETKPPFPLKQGRKKFVSAEVVAHTEKITFALRKQSETTTHTDDEH